MNILYVIADTEKEYNSARWRCDMPIEAINSTPDHEARKIFIKDWVENEKADPASEWADVIVLQRNMVAGGLHTAAKWQARGKPVIVDIDDGYEFMPQSVISAAFWKNNQSASDDGKREDLGFAPMQHLIMGLKLADAVTTPSKVIVSDRQPLQPNTFLLPNYPVAKVYLEAASQKQPREDGDIVIGWGGGGSHIDSFMNTSIIPALGRVLDARKNVRLLIMGPQEIQTRMRREFLKYDHRMTFEGWRPYTEWPSRLSRIDIGIAPLHGAYDRRRSWLKGIEFCLMGIPWLGTDYGDALQPYSDFADHHLVRNQAKHWTDALLYIVDHLEAARDAAKYEQEWAKQYDIYNNVENILSVYRKVL